MIAQEAASMKDEQWKDLLKDQIHSPLELLSILDIETEELPWAKDVSFPLKVPRCFIQKMQKQNPRCPLLLQVLSTAHEMLENNAFKKDPLEESKANPVPGLLHKFPTQALIITTKACPLHCRFCFRRHFPYSENKAFPSQEVISYLKQNPNIQEVILSGGDPLSLVDSVLFRFLKEIAEIPHIEYVRIHSRFPVVIPERLTATLADVLSKTRLKPCLVLHVNHPHEVCTTLEKRIHAFQEKGVLLLAQTVLLKDINDDAEVLKTLFKRLYACNILPYYLHQLDPVQGAQHFEVKLSKAKEIVTTLSQKLPGFLLPKWVREIPGKKSKTPISWWENRD